MPNSTKRTPRELYSDFLKERTVCERGVRTPSFQLWGAFLDWVRKQPDNRRMDPTIQNRYFEMEEHEGTYYALDVRLATDQPD